VGRIAGRWWLALAASSLVVACVPNASPHQQISDPGEHIQPSALRVVRGIPGRVVDAFGRDVQLRGVNLNSLGDYFEADPRLPTVDPLVPAVWERIAERGYNVVRLVTSWSAWEPERGRIDERYVERVHDAVEAARAAGLYVVIDMHQDAWSKTIYTPPGETCPAGTAPQIGWDGAPEWATITHGASTCGQGGGVGGREKNPAVMSAWAAFYSNEAGIRDELAKLWGVIAERFAGDDTIAGYDLLNEPGYSNDQNQTISGLVEFYRSALREIRAGEQHAGGPPRIAFFEGVLGTVPVLPFDFSDDPDLAFAPHNYAEAIGPSVPGLLELLSSVERLLGGLYRTPVWTGEYGDFGGDTSAWFSRFGRSHDLVGFVGGAWWQWSSGCGDPHALAVDWPLSETEIIERASGCNAAGQDGASDQASACAMRSYPVAAPGLAGWNARPCGGPIEVSGDSRREGTPTRSAVDLWYQPEPATDATARPAVTGDGAGTTTMWPTGYGWHIRVEVAGPYRLTVAQH